MMMPRSVLAQAAVDETPSLRVSTKYMETFQTVQPALGGADLTTQLNSAGNLDIYSVGTNNEVYRLRRTDAGNAPYAMERLGIAAQQLFLWSAGSGDPDWPNIFGVDSQGNLTLSTHNAAGSYTQIVCQPAKATEKIRQFLGVRGTTGNIYANVVLDNGVLANNYLVPGSSPAKWGGDTWVPIQGPDGDVKPVTIAMCANDPVQSALFAIGQKNEVLFSEDSYRTSKMRVLTSSATLAAATDLCVVADSKGKLNIFAVESKTGALWWKKERDYSTGGQIQFEDWVRIESVCQHPLVRVAASQCFDGLLQVFGIGRDGHLYRAAQVSSGRGKATWRPLFPLGNSVGNAAFTVGQTKSKYSEAYTVSPAGEVRRFWQAPTTEQWYEETVNVPKSDDTITRVPTHAVEISVLDAAGMPLPGAAVSISAGYLVTLFVDGKSYRCSQVESVQAKTAADGKVVIHQRANALAAAPLYVETAGTLKGAPQKVQANAQLQGRLTAMTVDDILQAKDASGAFLLPDEYRTRDHAESLQQVTAASMAIAAQEGGGQPVSYHFTSRKKAAFGFNPGTDLSALNGTAWEIDFSGGFPKYNKTTVDAVRTWKAEQLQKLGATNEVDGFLGIDWGEVWNGIKQGFDWIIKGLTKIVVTIVEGVGEVLFELAGKVFKAVIQFAQQAFDFIEGVWNWIKVTLQKLYEWLAFLFNIGDFVRTAEVMRHTIGTVLDFTAEGVVEVKKKIMAGVDTLKHDLDDAVNKFLAELNHQKDPTVDAYSSQHKPSDDDTYQADHNVMMNAYKENHEQAKPHSSAALVANARLQSVLDDVVKKLQAMADNFQFDDGKKAFDKAVQYFTSIGTQPDRALQLLMSGIIETLEATALFAVDFARGVIGCLLDAIVDLVKAFKEVLFAEWEIPVLSWIYKLFTGHSLSIRVVDVLAYVVAIPGTLIFKLVAGRAPFPDDAAVQRYEQFFTVDYLKSKLDPSRESRQYDALAGDKTLHDVGLIFYSACMFARIFVDGYTALKAAGSLDEVRDGRVAVDTPQLMTGMSVGLGYLAGGFTCPWLLNTDLGGLECGAGNPGFSGVIWICGLVFGPTRGLVIAAFMDRGKARTYTAELSASVWGAVNIIMTVWHYCWTAEDKRDPVGLARSLTASIPGQFLRFLATPDMNKSAEFIPVAILVALQSLGYMGSIGCARAGVEAVESAAPVALVAAVG